MSSHLIIDHFQGIYRQILSHKLLWGGVLEKIILGIARVGEYLVLHSLHVSMKKKILVGYRLVPGTWRGFTHRWCRSRAACAGRQR